MSTVIFVKRNDAYRWAMMWAVAEENRIVVDSSVIATTMNPSFADDLRPVAAACAANILVNAARTGRDVAVVENVPAIERRLRFVAKKEGMAIKEMDGTNGPSPSTVAQRTALPSLRHRLTFSQSSRGPCSPLPGEWSE